MNKRYLKSHQMLERAEQSIPLGSQTFSKSKLSYPLEQSPLFLERGQGCQVWDVDGNQYTDFVNGLLCVSLGYCDHEVDKAVIEQLKQGVTFSLPHRLEMEVAEQLIELIPSAQMVRFGKNGSDATSAAIRLARAFTGREQVAVCGYHGWQDWYIGSTTRDLGVPKSTKALTHTFTYNDIASLEALFEQNPEQIAAVILEPMNLYYPKDDFLERVQQLCQQQGALLIFDETITGFRFSLGGAQALFGITPDLSTFGKGMANGFPISAVVGRRDVMEKMEDIFFSGTFAGETLSLAATKAAISKLQSQDVLTHIHAMGERLLDGLKSLISEHGYQDWLTLCGHPSWSFLLIGDRGQNSALELKSLFLQEMAKRGFLMGGGHNLSFAHTRSDIDSLLSAYRKVLPLLDEVAQNGNFDSAFKGQLLTPIFKVR